MYTNIRTNMNNLRHCSLQTHGCVSAKFAGDAPAVSILNEPVRIISLR